MSELLKELKERSGEQCELCAATDHLQVYTVPDSPSNVKDTAILVCKKCLHQLENEEEMDPNHWRSLNDSMWSQIPAVQVVVYRTLHKLRNEGWPSDLLEMMYLEEDVREWALEGLNKEPKLVHKDSNGKILTAGDSIVLIKDLDVKGANFIAKRGTAVRNISLVHDNANHIEGKVNGQHIVILTQFIKKT